MNDTKNKVGWYEKNDYPIEVEVVASPDNKIIPEGLPVLITSGKIGNYLRVGKCYEAVTGSAVKFYKDHTLSVGDTINSVAIIGIDTTNEDYDILRVPSATFTVRNYAVTNSIYFNGICNADTDLSDGRSSILVKTGGQIMTTKIPKEWRAEILNQYLSSTFAKW